MPSSIDFIDAARDITGSADIDTVVKAARKLEALWKGPPKVTTQASPPSPTGWSFYPWPFQRDLLTSLEENRISLVCAAPQMGITATIAYNLIHEAATRPDIRILASGTYQPEEPMKMLKRLAHMSPTPVVYSNHWRITFENGSSIVSERLETGWARGQRADTVWIDHCTRLSYGLDEEVEAQLGLLVAGGSRIILSGGSARKRGLFYEWWTKRAEAKCTTITWEKHPERGEDWEESHRKFLSPEQFSHMYECQFAEAF